MSDSIVVEGVVATVSISYSSVYVGDMRRNTAEESNERSERIIGLRLSLEKLNRPNSRQNGIHPPVRRLCSGREETRVIVSRYCMFDLI